MRSVLGKAAAFAVATMVAGGAVVGCSAATDPDAKPEENLGSVGLQFRAGPGIRIPAVNMEVTFLDDPSTAANEADYVAMTRTIPSPDRGSDFNFAVSLPPGVYHVKLVADAGNPHPVHCEANADFTIVRDQTSQVGLELYCDDVIHNGVQKYDVEVVSDVCPLEVDYASASPTNVRVGTDIVSLSGSAHDECEKDANGNPKPGSPNPDCVPSPWAFTWTASPASAGTFADPAVANTTFTCAGPADPVILTLTGTRPGDADGLGCSDSISVWVTCASALCGNGVPNPGETCDDGNNIDTDSCPNDCSVFCGDGDVEGDEDCEEPVGVDDPGCSNCQTVAFCGDGLQNQPSEECDDGTVGPGQTDACRAGCRVPRCGDGVHNSLDPASEQCDAASLPTATCDINCQTIVGPGSCGDSIVGNAIAGSCGAGSAAGCDVCDPPTAGVCASNCQPFTNAACLACETGNVNCQPLITACDLLAAGTPRDQCNQVTECVRRTNCAEYQNTDCYCGSNADPGACAEETITPNGECRTIIMTALNATSTSQVLSRYVNRSFPGGVALSRLTCDRANCAGGTPVGELSTTQCFAEPVPPLP